MQLNKNKIGHFLALFTIIIWGSTFIASKYLLSWFSPEQIMLMRFVLAYVILFILNHNFKKPKLKEELGFLFLGLTGCTLYFLTENMALVYTQTSNVSIIVAAAPILTAVIAHFFTKDERLTRYIIMGAAIAFAGVILVVYNGTIILKLNPMGDILSFLAALCWAVYTVALKKYINKYDSVYLARKCSFYGFITALPIVIFRGGINLAPIFSDYKILLCILFLGIIASGICYVTWNKAIDYIGVISTNNYIYINPFVTMVTAYFILSEHITIMGLIGAVLIICGVAVAGYKKKQIISSNLQ